ncbi:MAG: SRPBCC domain-containing protein [Acidimicrobiia bacterium]|nr:SRPBCC domain-containing protein [Acidimicrobiia bacterium]MDH4307043.1 SRPBCC domain-containing protein [Acidimicrobiia bacterium]
MVALRTVVAERTLALSRAEAWAAVTVPDWLGVDAILEPRIGGRVAVAGRTGIVTEVVSAQLLCWEWSGDGDPGWSTVQVRLTSRGAGTSIEIIEVLHGWEQEIYPAQGHASGGGLAFGRAS